MDTYGANFADPAKPDFEVIGKEKLGGGFVTVLIKGDVAAVKAAVEAGKARVEGLGKLVAAHVIARPSSAILSLLPTTPAKCSSTARRGSTRRPA